MAEKSKISWTSATWNPIVGCRKASPGCDHCYAIRGTYRMAHHPGVQHLYQGLVTSPLKEERAERDAATPDWTGTVRFLKERLVKPYEWRHNPRTIFVCSMSDLFHQYVEDDIIVRIFDVMCVNPMHTYQVLTKRPHRLFKDNHLTNQASLYVKLMHLFERHGHQSWPEHIWFGTSVEDNAHRWRIPFVKRTGAPITFISAEPLLESLTLVDPEEGNLVGITWLITGAESGPGRRSMHEDWVRQLRDQCARSNTLFYYKQKMEGNRKVELPLLDGVMHDTMPPHRGERRAAGIGV
jgi:protein gp37